MINFHSNNNYAYEGVMLDTNKIVITIAVITKE